MIHIKRFIDKVSYTESKQSKDLILPMTDARGLRDELAKLLADLASADKPAPAEEIIDVKIVGGKF
jgi:hypothetical protein